MNIEKRPDRINPLGVHCILTVDTVGLLPFQRSELALRLKPIVQARAKARQGERNDIINISQKSDKCSNRTDNEIAKAANVSRDTIRKAEYILQNHRGEVL